MRAAVVGSPIVHSLSPLLHRAAYTALGLDWTYQAIDVTVAQFDPVVSQLREDATFVGLSVTMPLKRRARELADTHTEVSAATGVANTLTKVRGALVADNTDPAGIAFALGRVGISDLSEQSVGILGAGATAASALFAACQLNAASVEVIARREGAVADLAHLGSELGMVVTGQGWSLQPRLDQDVVISVVPAGVADDVMPTTRGIPGTLLDVVYAPWPSILSTRWANAGGVVADGLDMLVGQAAAQVTSMTTRPAPLPAMLRAAATTR